MISPEQWNRFFDALQRRGNITDAALAASVSRVTVYEHIKLGEAADATPEAKEWLAKFKEAKEVALDRLESEAFRRAHDGIDEPIVGRIGKDQDGIITHAKRYSDGLLQFLLRAHRPERYKERVAQEVSGPGGGPVQTVSKVIAVPAIEAGAQE